MVKRATPKRVVLPSGISFLVRYERDPRDRLPPNVTRRRRCAQRNALKNKCRRQVKIGLLNFIKKVAKNPAIKSLGRSALKRVPNLLGIVSKRTKNKTLKSILDSNVTKAIVRRGSKNRWNKLGYIRIVEYTVECVEQVGTIKIN